MKKKILYVEDDIDTADAASVILEREGYHVETASLAGEAIKMVEDVKYDLVLIDIMLPDMSGWDLIKKISKKGTIYAVLSALPYTKDRQQKVKRMGLADYITKPFTKDSLRSRVNRVLKKK